MGELMTTPDYWPEAKQHLRRNCPVMKTLIDRYTAKEGLSLREDGFYTLIRAIVGQQISVKAADSVWAKLQSAVDPLTPEALSRKRPQTLRNCGLSAQKVTYTQNVARFWLANDIPLTRSKASRYWQHMTDAEAIAHVSSIKGIGEWTAEMFLIFHLGRPDIFPLKDLGVLKSIDRHYALEKPKKADYLALAERWRPYRSVATWYLWRALDPVPVAY
jgi:DNA-3-methyladenine glycosylase II